VNKACVTCKHHHDASQDCTVVYSDYCRHPETEHFDAVYGGMAKPCRVVREHDGQCGPDGDLWEPKPTRKPWYRRLF
jgi:hypothetical protein